MEGSELIERVAVQSSLLARVIDLEAPAEHLPEPISSDLLSIIEEARSVIEASGVQSLSERLREPTLHMVQAALEEARRHDPPLLPPCKELWAAELIWRAMAAALTKEGIARERPG